MPWVLTLLLTADEPPPLLSKTGLFQASPERIAADCRPFAPQYPLWSDGATKRRWIRLPKGATIDARDPESWSFPVGTRFWKEFSFAGKKVETRLIEKRGPSRWWYATYAWNDEQTDAVLVGPAGRRNVAEIAPGVSHDLPGQTDCRACHEGSGRDPVLGFSALQLSSDRDPNAPHAERPPEGTLDLAKLLAERRLTGAPRAWATTPPRIAAATPTARAALGYLHANCWGCHNEKDSVGSVGLSLRASITATETDQPTLKTAWQVKSHFQTPGVPDDQRLRLTPGHAASSSIVFRMRSRHPVHQMPPLGSELVDEAAVDLLTRWIDGH